MSTHRERVFDDSFTWDGRLKVLTPDCSELGTVARTLAEVQRAMAAWVVFSKRRAYAILFRNGNQETLDALCRVPYLSAQTIVAIYGMLCEYYDESLSHTITEDVLQIFAEKAQMATALRNTGHSEEQIVKCVIPFPPEVCADVRALVPDGSITAARLYVVLGDDIFFQKVSNRK